jgi:NTE family protein
VLDAVRASCAMPGLLTPVIRDGVVLVDGGLVNPVPVSMCRALGADLVVAVDLSWGKLGPYRRTKEREVAPREEPSWLGRFVPGKAQRKGKPDNPSIVSQDEPSIPSIFNVFLTSLDIVEMRVARSRLAGEPADVLITPLLPDFATMDFHRGAALSDRPCATPAPRRSTACAASRHRGAARSPSASRRAPASRSGARRRRRRPRRES